jgi:hypothetical protein
MEPEGGAGAGAATMLSKASRERKIPNVNLILFTWLVKRVEGCLGCIVLSRLSETSSDIRRGEW